MLAPFEGYIADAPRRAGDVVRVREVLCALDDRDLKLERLKWRSQREQYVKQYQEALAQRNAALVQIITAQIAQAEAELALVEDHLERAQLRAPFERLVVSGDLSQSIGAPVERGKVLFEVAPSRPIASSLRSMSVTLPRWLMARKAISSCRPSPMSHYRLR